MSDHLRCFAAIGFLRCCPQEAAPLATVVLLPKTCSLAPPLRSRHQTATLRSPEGASARARGARPDEGGGALTAAISAELRLAPCLLMSFKRRISPVHQG